MRFTVVVPTYNRGTLVARAIESVFAQEYAPDAVIVVDDGSTDDTAEIVERFGDRVRYVRQANAGCSAARNRGVKESASEWIAFLDSDDTWSPGHLQAMAIAIAETGGRADFYFANSDFPPHGDDEPRSLWGLSGFSIRGPFELVEDGSDWVMRRRQPMKLQCSVFRRSKYDELGGLREDLPTREDTHFFMLWGLGRPVCAVAEGGVRISYDDAPSNRLTTVHPPSGRIYLDATVRLYADTLKQRTNVDAHHRRELRRRLATARFRLARLDVEELRLHRACWNMLCGLATQPRALVPMVGRTLRRWLP